MATASNDIENKGGDQTPDTSDKADLVNVDATFDQDGNEVVSEPEKKETPTDDGKSGGDEPSSKSSDQKTYKYKTIDEYDKAYKEAEKKMHESTTRSSSLERELAQYKKPVEKTPVTIDDQITEFTTSAIKEIRALPAKFNADGKETQESIEERETKSAVIWGKANRKIARLEYDETSKAEKGEKEIANKLYKQATADGLSTNDELDLVGIEYGRTDPSMSNEDRISAAVESVKSRVSRLREGFVKKQQLDKKEKDDLKVLGGGSRNRPTSDGKDKAVSKPDDMSSALSDIKEKRRVKTGDLLRN